MVLPNLDSGLLTEGRITSAFQQINALISPGINNYNSLFIQAQRRFRQGLAFQTAYTFSKNMMSRGVDFNNQFDFSNTHSPYLLDQRHRLSIAAVYEPNLGANLNDGFLRTALSDWTISTVMQFASGRPYAALIDVACPNPDVCNSLNNTAALQATANSALGINSGSPSPFAGLDSFYGPWTEQIDLGLARRFKVTERHAVSLQAQVFNVMNHAELLRPERQWGKLHPVRSRWSRLAAMEQTQNQPVLPRAQFWLWATSGHQRTQRAARDADLIQVDILEIKRFPGPLRAKGWLFAVNCEP